jgi:hypothetical protein
VAGIEVEKSDGWIPTWGIEVVIPNGRFAEVLRDTRHRTPDLRRLYGGGELISIRGARIHIKPARWSHSGRRGGRCGVRVSAVISSRTIITAHLRTIPSPFIIFLCTRQYGTFTPSYIYPSPRNSPSISASIQLVTTPTLSILSDAVWRGSCGSFPENSTASGGLGWSGL